MHLFIYFFGLLGLMTETAPCQVLPTGYPMCLVSPHNDAPFLTVSYVFFWLLFPIAFEFGLTKSLLASGCKLHALSVFEFLHGIVTYPSGNTPTGTAASKSYKSATDACRKLPFIAGHRSWQKQPGAQVNIGGSQR